MKIAVIGDPTFTTGFRLAGVDEHYEVRDKKKDDELDDAVEDALNNEEIGIIVMHQDDLDHLSRTVREDVETSIEPTLVTLGGGEGGSEQLRQQIKRAIGIDLMD